MIISNIIISVITYYQNKDKKGIAGDKGIKGQIGDTGNRGKCEKNAELQSVSVRFNYYSEYKHFT